MLAYGAVPRLKCGVDYPLSPCKYTVVICNVRFTSIRDVARTSRMRRVEMWRGDVRLSMSVSAPFVWRCLSGATVAPFPHPAHRTGQADLSGSSAIAGFRPHRTHRAALPQWALQKGPEAGRSLPPCLMDRRSREGEGIQELAEGHPVHAALLAAFAEHLAPLPDDAVLEHAQ